MKRFSMIVLLLCCGIGVWAENKIMLSNAQGAAGTEITISVSMTNSDAVSALQLSIPLDDNFTFVENSQKKGSRLSNHTLSAGVKDGILNVMLYSTTMAVISGNDGEVCSFKLLLGDNPGIVSLTPSKVSLSGTSGNLLIVSATSGNIETRGAKAQIDNSTINFGRVPINGSSLRSVWIKNVGNEMLTISEISFSSSIFSTESTLPITINEGNSQWININCKPTINGAFDEEMTIMSNSVTGKSTVRLIATSYGQNELRLVNVSGTTGEEVVIPVVINNIDDITGFQMEIKLPNELEYVDGSFVLSNRKQDHIATASSIDGILSMVAYSPTDKAFTGDNGEIGSFSVKIVGSNNTYLNIDKAMLSSTVNGKTADVLSDKSGCAVTIKSPNMRANNNLDFGSIAINQEERKKSFYIWNNGSAPLIISKVTFSNGQFKIKEELPITIEPSSNKEITVICTAKDAGDISTIMEVYTNDPNNRLYIINVTGKLTAPNYLIGSVEGNRIGMSLSISLNNYSEIYGIQFDINTTKNFTASVDNVVLTERGKNLSYNINSIGEGKLRVVAYVKNDLFIGSGEGEVMTIKLVPNEVLPEGDYAMTISNILLGSKGMQNVYKGDETLINYYVTGVIPGDANKDGKIGIGDIIAITNIMAGKTDGFDIKAADANQDNKVDKEDINVILNFMAGY